MKTNFNVTGSERKRLVQTISKSCGEDSRYLGAPSMAYEVGPFTVSRDGTLEFSDSIDSEIVEKLYDDIAAAGFDFERPEQPADEGEPAGFGLSVILPAESLDEDAMRNLEALLTAKGSLIRKADFFRLLLDQCHGSNSVASFSGEVLLFCQNIVIYLTGLLK